MRTSFALILSLVGASAASLGIAAPDTTTLEAALAAVEPEVVAWRRHLHQHPELSNREEQTAAYVADALRAMGLEPQTGIARHGLKAVITGGKPGPVIALRADMDALPVAEEVDLPFASRATGEYEGKVVPVMHACGHDAHMAMLLGAAKVLVGIREQLAGTVVLIFQPAEEGAPPGEQPAGAEQMIAEGVLDDPAVDLVFGIHVFAGYESGRIGYRPGPMLAASDRFEIIVEGRQAHGSKPWAGIDPIVIGAELVGAIQTLVSRQVDITHEPAVVSVGQFEAGVRNNIIPDRARLVGTIRTFDAAMQDEIHSRLERLATHTAAAHGATAKVTIERGYPVTVNDAELAARMVPTLERVAPGRVDVVPKITGAEDFSFYAQRVPGLFISLGVTPREAVAAAASNHSPRFFVDEAALVTGVATFVHLAVDAMGQGRD
jgi:amidohydrolase